MFPRVVELLTNDEVHRIHEASLEILEDVGLEVINGRAREIFRRHGCRVDEETRRVTIPCQVVERFMQAVPSKFTFRARCPDFDRTIPDDAPLTMTASSAPNVIDPVTKHHRRATSDDIAQIARLVNELPGVDLFSISVLADDAPPGQYSLTRFYSALKYCQKPIRGSGDGGDCEAVLKLAYAVAGSQAAYREHPFITHHTCPMISPLKMDENSTELLMFYAEKGLPSHPTVVPNAGLTSPLTLAGTLAQGNAEFLALAVLTQMVRAETPMVYSSLSTVGDMRSGAYAPGGIECGMLNMAHAQMARYYNVPCIGYIGLTNSKLVDAQAGYEKALSCMGGLLAGMHVLQFVGLIDALLAFDFGMAVIDSEIGLMLKRVARGIEMSAHNLAVDEIAQVGPGGMFITAPRTLELMASAAFLPDIADRRPRQEWEQCGALDAHSRALKQAREILCKSSDSLFSPEVDQRIRSQFTSLVPGA
jgi:trimethylamine--corrinoid protein Co-methyltransferase